MTNITIITGTSGVGKSTLKEIFSTTYGGSYAVYDFDDVGVPEGADEQRRKETTQYWITKLREDEIGGVKSILFGQLIPDEITSQKDDIAFVLLEASREELQKRLQERGWKEEFIATYKGRSDYIKNSVMRQKKWNIVSTMGSREDAVYSILNFISQ